MTLKDLTDRLANDWLAYRRDYGKDLPKPFRERLDLLERMTAGSPGRCQCFAGPRTGGEQHGLHCPARKLFPGET